MGCALALAKQGYVDIHVWEAASSLGGESVHPPLRRERRLHLLQDDAAAR